MATFDNAMALAAKQARWAGIAGKIARRHHTGFAHDIRGLKDKLTGGKISAATLRKAGHPFARRRRRGNFDRQVLQNPGARRRNYRQSTNVRTKAVSVFPKLPINRQTGKLRQSLRFIQVERTLGGQKYYIGHKAKHAAYVLSRKGTRNMVPRGYEQEHLQQARRLERDMLNRLRPELYRTWVRLR